MKTLTLAKRLQESYRKTMFPPLYGDMGNLADRQKLAWNNVARLASRLLNQARYRRKKKKENNETQNGKIKNEPR